ncbi:unnamed protein product, partial [Meganyctiphanes norvegica]
MKFLHKDHKSEIKKIICDVCGKLVNASYFSEHLQWKHSNLKPIRCNICVKDLKNKYSLMRHMRYHHSSTSGEKPFLCAICGEAFRQSNHIKRHMMLHSGEKPFSCTLCDYRTNHLSNITIHMKSHRKQLSKENVGMEHQQLYEDEFQEISNVQPKNSYFCNSEIDGQQ